ncbi:MULTISPECIES: chemotaxis response regulator protein-glutamate methylesterase [unclassified Undibacterium]|uniref:protein-glutamate methylesterase/protein-glutamine glutaminase n=1 Tax=unclassified Undibacterium TaxID=2630295 RepID=UPI002AC98C57|nr:MULTISPECIES: chemotaxis response regulator protein-glutamate methylesterase [unclassified Undibacterium]MEB0140734.1 chemotaxis response regulator protein-glutamate methylesterase [Undibacterium sp. CCC2.1]MEB0174093.1 chemotaxis response regulator protein-glutamate methylesterase [Undibacterium sp. CCC1.1]MEB0178080.1 chemotaxis response regulator protein-glutamate methylesterase [Undibacterium sp. CCC3.4]MEB0216950.1 chemotaxis response regulator protein-glutamate methylesterase [Undibact
MLVDDSAVVRQVLAAVLALDPEIEVIGSASDPIFAMDKMNLRWPDVVVLDVEMPRMDGITFLKKLMSVRPTPVIICSTLTEKGATTSMQALAAGAVGIVTKPKAGLKGFLEQDAGDIVQAVKAAAQADMRRVKAMSMSALQVPAKLSLSQAMPELDIRAGAAMSETTDKIVAIGTSTGGTQALELVLKQLNRTAPGIVIVQHMPEKFTAAFAERLNKVCAIEVLEASNGDRVIAGRALIAPGGRHMQVKRSGAQYHVAIMDGPPVNRHRPSVDVLFRSVAKCAGANAFGIIMTGMGDDGALGMLDLHKAGAGTLAQDEKTCVVYGMPKEAVKLGAVDRIVPLGEIAADIEAYGRQHR